MCRTEQSSGSCACFWPSDCLEEAQILFWCLEDLTAKRSKADWDEISSAVHFVLAAMKLRCWLPADKLEASAVNLPGK